MKTRTNPLSAERANVLGAHAAEAENQVRWAMAAIERGDMASALERLRDAGERCDTIREECYFEKG